MRLHSGLSIGISKKSAALILIITFLTFGLTLVADDGVWRVVEGEALE